MSQAPEALDLVWSAKYQLGHPIIDSQHANLFDIYNRLVDGYHNCNGQQQVHQIIEELVGYTQAHFRDEESLMSKTAFTELKVHERAHSDLINEVEIFVADLDNDKPILTYEVLHFVKQWLCNHILKEDMKLKPYLEAVS